MIEAVHFEAFPGRSMCLAYCKPSKDLSDNKDHVLSQGLIVVNGSLILDPFILKVAANKCLVNETNGTMRTKSLAAELLYNLSPTLHVTESLKTFGLSPGMPSVLFVAFDISSEEFKKRLLSLVSEVELRDLNQLASNADFERIKTMYKIINPDDALNEIASTIAVKGI